MTTQHLLLYSLNQVTVKIPDRASPPRKAKKEKKVKGFLVFGLHDDATTPIPFCGLLIRGLEVLGMGRIIFFSSWFRVAGPILGIVGMFH